MPQALNPHIQFPEQPGKGPVVAFDYAAADQDPPTVARAIHVNGDGTLMLLLQGDPDGPGLPFVVKAGMTYSYSVRRIVKAGSTVGVAGNFVL